MTVTRRIPPDPATLLTDRQAAKRLTVSTRTVREYRYEGSLHTVNLGYRTKRVTLGDVDRLIAARTL